MVKRRQQRVSPTLVVDNGSDFVALQEPFHRLGLLSPRSLPRSPSRKAVVERTFGKLNLASSQELYSSSQTNAD